jgi:prepilin-type N-terminal cleavage/methylation domain-containing protein
MSNEISMLKIKKNLRGFTLTEIIVVVAIIGIMTSLVTVSMRTGRINKELEANAREFAGIVREAQNNALTGKQIGGNTACAFYVTWTAPSTYSLKYTPSGSCGASPTLIVSYSLKNGVTFSGGGTFNFKLPYATLSTPTVQATIFSKSGSSHVVCTYADGRVSDYPSRVTCP